MDLNCWTCLVSEMRMNTAVTLRSGTAYCEACAREAAEQEAADAVERQRMEDLVAGIAQRHA